MFGKQQDWFHPSRLWGMQSQIIQQYAQLDQSPIRMSDSLAKIRQYQNVEAFLFQIHGSVFTSFQKMQNYLQTAQTLMEQRISDLDTRMDSLHEQLIRTAGVYQLNNKKRQKQQQLLQIERQKIQRSLDTHHDRLSIRIHPMTLALKQKKQQITRLNQTKQIVQDFHNMTQGKEEDILKTLPLDQKHFSSSALKIFVFKSLLEDMPGENYDAARGLIRRKFTQLKTKIISNFKEGFIKADVVLVNHALPYCQEYELMEEIAQYYNEQAFKESHRLQRIETGSIEAEIKNFFFLLRRGFHFAYSESLAGERNGHRIGLILAKYGEFISRRLVAYAYQKLVKQTVDAVLKDCERSSDYLLALEYFYGECRSLLKECQALISDQKMAHLMQTYVESIFDIYLEGYLPKQITTLATIYEDNIGSIVEQIKAIDLLHEQVEEKKDTRKFSFKKLMDYKIETKRGYNPEHVRAKLQALLSIFMEPALQTIFERTKYALNRNNKIAKINDTNRNEILSVFFKQLGELINIIITSMRDVLPCFQDNAPALDHEFFQVIPQINVLLQRMEYLYVEHKKQARYELAESIKLEQKKEDLLVLCEKNLNKIVADALACILASEKTILREKTAYLQGQQEPISSKLYLMLEKYVKAINRISQQSYRQSLLRTLGLQFTTLLIQHYSTITYSKEGLGGIYVDVSGFGKVLKLIGQPAVEERFRVFKSLIDIYVLKNEEKELSGYLKTEKEGVLLGEKEETIRCYLLNKQRVERTA